MKSLAKAAVVAIICLPASAFATCADYPAETIFSCPLQDSSRQVYVCRTGDGLFVYKYGKPGKAAELELMHAPGQLNYQPWNGIGRYIWSSLTFDNKGYRYQVAYSADKNTGTEEGFLNVFEPGADEPLVSKACRAGTVNSILDGLDLGGLTVPARRLRQLAIQTQKFCPNQQGLTRMAPCPDP